MAAWLVRVMGLVYCATAVLLIYFLAILWPDWDPRTQQPCDNEIVVFFWRAFGISMRPELRVVLLVIFAGW